MTYNQIAFDILELLKNNQISDDVDISTEHIMYHVNIQRALWIRNEYNKPGRNIDPSIVTDLGCLRLIEVDAAECCSITTGCIALRTEKKIPGLIEFHNKPGIVRVGPTNKLLPGYSISTTETSGFKTHNKYSGNDIQAVYLNNYIYVVIPDPIYQGLDYINVRAIIENPEDVVNFLCDSTGSPCFSYDDEYPVKSWMIPYIKEQVLMQFGHSLQMPKDNDNNAKDNLSQS